MENIEIRTRMAPSPTGEFHIGGLRTLLFNYAWAKKNNGKFLLRIEDTDRNRYVDGSINRIIEAIRAYNLDWDEGPQVGGLYGPYIQSERLNIYREYSERLLAKKSAYYCFCTEERLSQLRNEAQKDDRTFKYDKHCLSLNESVIQEKLQNGEKYVVRLNVPSGIQISYDDFVLGSLSFPSDDIDDAVLLKSDGYPTYHFAVVVDDYLMKVTHVMRGGEWVSSTPKHVLLYRLFGFKEPKFGHLPNLKFVGTNKKMSKREGTSNALDFIKKGYLPEAVLNQLMFLGWNPGTEREIFSIDDFIKEFTLERINKTDLVSLDFEKLNWFNNRYIQKYNEEEFLDLLKKWSLNNNVSSLIFEIEKKYEPKKVLQILKLSKDRLNFLSEFDQIVDYYLNLPHVDSIALGKYSSNPKKVLTFFKEYLNSEFDYTFENLDFKLHELIKGNNLSTKEYFMTLRIAITGEIVTPPIIEIISILDKEMTLERLDSAISVL